MHRLFPQCYVTFFFLLHPNILLISLRRPVLLFDLNIWTLMIFQMINSFVFSLFKNFHCNNMQKHFLISSTIEYSLTDSTLSIFFFIFWCEIIGFLSSCRQQFFLIKMLWNLHSKIIRTFEKYIKIFLRT